MKVLVKIKGRKKSRSLIHAYNEATDSALCRAWPKPGKRFGPECEWEVQEIDDFMAIPERDRCLHCTDKLAPAPPIPYTPREQRRQTELEKLAAWNAQAV